MKSLVRKLPIIAISLVFSAGAQAESWSCSHDNDVREVYIERAEGAVVPCDVVYRKPTEGAEDQVLWSAQNDESYCDAKAAAFVEKLQGWGWSCGEAARNETSG